MVFFTQDMPLTICVSGKKPDAHKTHWNAYQLWEFSVMGRPTK